MAKKAATMSEAKTEAKKPNLFAKAKTAVAEAPAKKPKGTTFKLPQELDTEGKLTGESAVLNESVGIVIQAHADETAAKNRGNLAKGQLSRYVLGAFSQEYARLCVQPPTPYAVVNHVGQAVTYVVQDKSQQNGLSQDQVDMIAGLLGVDVANSIIHTRDVYGFNADTMGEAAANSKDESVAEVVCSLVSEVIAGCKKLSQEQKDTLITSTSKTMLKPGTVSRIAELCGSDATRIQQFIEAAGTSIVKYLKS